MSKFEKQSFDDDLEIQIIDLPDNDDEQVALSTDSSVTASFHPALPPGQISDSLIGNLRATSPTSLTPRHRAGSAHALSQSPYRSQVFNRKALRAFFRARAWLWTATSGDDFIASDQQQDIDLEISDLPDLPPSRKSWLKQQLPGPGRRIMPRKRAWRATLTVGTLLLALLLVSILFPNAGASIIARFAPQSRAPALIDASGINISPSGSASGSFLSAEAVTAGISATPIVSQAAPGQMPPLHTCAQFPSPVNDGEVGQSPVWLSGFDGPSAHLHLRDASVFSPNFPSAYSWAVHLKLELAVGFTEPVIITGRAQQDGQYLLFAFDPSFDMGQKLSLTLDPADPMTPPSSTPASRLQKISWDLTVYIPAADCYRINLAWPDGSEHIDFVAGW